MAWPYRLLECRHCGLGFVDPKPSWELLQTFYDQSYGPYDSSCGSPEREAPSAKYRIARLRMASARSQKFSAVACTSLGSVAEWLTGRTVTYSLGVPLTLPTSASIFDLGYGSGNWLLAMARLGYRNLHGYDIDSNPWHSERLRSQGIAVSSGAFLENDYAEASFDCIRLEQVFEHLLDPIAVLKQCHRMLKPGGFLVMTLPCKNSWSMRLSLQSSPTLKLPEHLFHHTLRSARLMMAEAGFVQVRIRSYTIATALGVTVSTMRASRKKRPLPLALFHALAPAYKVLGAATGKGEGLTVWAQRARLPAAVVDPASA